MQMRSLFLTKNKSVIVENVQMDLERIQIQMVKI